MIRYLKNILMYFAIGSFFTLIIVYFYDGNLKGIDQILLSALLFTIISIAMEKVMMVLYTKINLCVVLRIIITTITGLGLYAIGVWVTQPRLLDEIFYIPIFIITIFPMFVSFAIIFDYLFRKRERLYNNKLKDLKKNSQYKR